jgi:outer membrane protein TolC
MSRRSGSSAAGSAARVCGLAVALAAGLGAALGAGAAGAQEEYVAPRFDYGDGRIDLAEAVRLALAHDPNLLLSREDVRLQQGVLGQQRGLFDWTVAFDLSYDYKEQELRNSTIQSERDKRDELSVQNQFTCQQVGIQDAKIAQLRADLAGAPIDPNDYAATTDGFFQAQLRFFQERLAAATDPQEIQALVNSRNALLTRELAIAVATRDEFQELCLETRDALDKLGSIPEFEEFAAGKASFQLSKLYRSGVGFAPFLEATYDHTQFPGKRNGFFEPRLENGQPVLTEFGTPLQRFVDFGGKNVEDLYKAEIGFSLNLPLLRGGGAVSVAAPERAAAVDLEASSEILRHAASVTALNAAAAYWSLVAAQERVAVQERSVELQGKLVALTEELIAGDQVPRVERARALAGQANSRAALDGARRDLVSARLALARTLGVDVAGQANAPLAAGSFPAPPAPDAVRAIDSSSLAESAVGSRLDRKAARKLVDSGRILADAARHDLADRLDLALTLSANALGEKSFSEAIDRWSGPGGSIALAYEKQVGNRSRRGILGQQEAVVRQRQISAGDLERTIRIAVVETLGSLEQALARLAEAEAAAKYAQETIDAEFEKLRAGASTLIDAILTEQQRTSAVLSVIAARQQVATLLAQLAFEAGQLVEGEGEGGRVLVERLTALPGSGAAAGGQP